MAVILFFGRLSDLSGPLDVTLPNDVKTSADLIKWLSETYPVLKMALAQTGNRLAVNQRMTRDIVPIANTDEIAFMSPLSGG
jgi:molybdopterin converting factor small subunit